MLLLQTRFEYTEDQLENIKKLKTKIEQECNNLYIKCDNILLSKFLNFANWQENEAFERIQNYYDFKKQHPDWIATHNAEYFREQFYQTKSRFIMPKPDKNGRIIVIIKAVDAFKKFPNYLFDLIEMDDLIFESLFLLPLAQANGISIIYDMREATMKFLRLLTPSFSKMVNEKNEVLPFKTRTLHLVQKTFLMSATSALIMPFMSKQFRENTFNHDGKHFEKLRDMIGYENLPHEYGGPEENVLDVDLLYNHLIKNTSYLEELQTFKRK